MNNILDLIKTPKDVNNDIVKRMRARIAFVLGCQDDFEGLFAKKGYSSIQEVIDGQRK